MPIALTKDTYRSTIEENDIVLVDFWASWCGPCRSFAPVFDGAADDNPDLVFAKVDTEAEHELAGTLGIMSIPTLAIFRGGIPVFAKAGALPRDVLDDLIRQIRALDMEEVRAVVASGD